MDTMYTLVIDRVSGVPVDAKPAWKIWAKEPTFYVSVSTNSGGPAVITPSNPPVSDRNPPPVRVVCWEPSPRSFMASDSSVIVMKVFKNNPSRCIGEFQALLADLLDGSQNEFDEFLSSDGRFRELRMKIVFTLE